MRLDKSTRDALIEKYAAGPARLRAAYGAVPEAARQWRPAPDQWSAHEVVVHCADSESNAALRIRYLVAEKDPVIVGYDQETWAKTLDYHAHPVEIALQTVDAVRAHTVALLRRLPEEAWGKMGTHTESGAYGAEDWLESYAAHVANHSDQIDRNVAAWRAQKA